MAQAFQLGLRIPLAVSYLISLLVYPAGHARHDALISRMQVWTQPIWLVAAGRPVRLVAVQDPGQFAAFTHFGGTAHRLGLHLHAVRRGRRRRAVADRADRRAGRLPALHAGQDRRRTPSAGGPRCWSAGPGWVVLGALKMLGGAFLAFYVAGKAGPIKADQPIQHVPRGPEDLRRTRALGLATSLRGPLADKDQHRPTPIPARCRGRNFFSRLRTGIRAGWCGCSSTSASPWR